MNSHTKISQDLRVIAAMSVLSGGALLFGGCSSEPESHVVSAPPPPAPTTQVVVTQPSPQPVYTSTGQTANGAIIVMQAPPAPQQEVVMAQPSSDHRWVPGYWTWRNSRYEWMAGHWELPPNQNSVWVAPRWERTSDGAYRFYEGYWN
ncbi:MAG: hypothetical protein JWQ62_2912 [Lacunisphaera sp.]|nr:hypothetical protein [Lacunisphaera sp.]